MSGTSSNTTVSRSVAEEPQKFATALSGVRIPPPSYQSVLNKVLSRVPPAHQVHQLATTPAVPMTRNQTAPARTQAIFGSHLLMTPPSPVSQAYPQLQTRRNTNKIIGKKRSFPVCFSQEALAAMRTGECVKRSKGNNMPSKAPGNQ